MAYNSPFAASPFDRSIVSSAQTETAAGEFWTIKKDGEDWPLIICDEEMVLMYYAKKQRPANARQPDGTWADGYKNGENRVGQRCYPTLFLGKYKFAWTPCKILEPFDEEIGQVVLLSTENPLLAKAWREALQYQVIDALPYFKDRLHQQSLKRSQSKAPFAAAPVTRKRKGTPISKCPPGYRVEQVDDEESSDFFVQGENNSMPRIEQEFSEPTFSAEIEALYEDTDNTNLPQPVSKRPKIDTAGRFPMPPGEFVGSGTINSSGSGMRQSVGRAAPMGEAKKGILDDPHRVMMYVDNPHMIFNVKRSGLDASPFLTNIVAHDPEHGWYVMSPFLSALREDEFLPVGEYLERGEYDPNILDEGTEYVRLAIEMTEAERGEEAVRSATIYSIAQLLELPGLQDLAFRKLKALATWDPHQAFAILCVVESNFKKAADDLRQYLVQYLADHYWELVLAETVKMAEVMRGIEGLEKVVFRLLAGPVEVDVHMDTDVEIKKEENDAKVKVEGPSFSENVTRGDKSDDEKMLADEEKLFGEEEKAVDKQKEKVSREKKVEKPAMKPATASASATNHRKPTAPSLPTNYKKPTVADMTEDGKEGIARNQAEMIRAALRESNNEAARRT